MILVAIIGGSGSGKTSVAKELISFFPSKSNLLSMDNYYKDLPSGVDPRNFNFDDPKAFDFELFEEDLKRIKSGEDIKLPVYNMVTYRREAGIMINFEVKDLIVVEGLFLLYNRHISDFFDFSVYIDAPSDERLIRRIERDTVERGRTVESILTQYRKYVAPSFKTFIEPQKYYCDIVLPEGASNKIGMNIIKNAIEKMLETKQEGIRWKNFYY